MSIVNSGGGLSQAEVDARIETVAPTVTPGEAGPASVFVLGPTIADDGVYIYDFGTGISTGSLIVTCTASANRGVFTFRAQTSSAFCVAISASGITATTGALTGTTGADATVTIATHTDHKLYVENRTGSAQLFHLTIGRTQTA